MFGDQIEGFSPSTPPPEGGASPGKLSAEEFIARFLAEQEPKPGDPLCTCGWSGEGFHCGVCHVSALTLGEFQALVHPGHLVSAV